MVGALIISSLCSNQCVSFTESIAALLLGNPDSLPPADRVSGKFFGVTPYMSLGTNPATYQRAVLDFLTYVGCYQTSE